MKRFLVILAVAVVSASQPACIWKLWSKGPPIEERTFDVYGEVDAMGMDSLTVQTKQGSQTFLLSPASVKGSDSFEKGQLVHVFYRKLNEGNIVTLVVKKID